MSDYIAASEGITSDLVVDVKGIHCPMPLLRIKKEIAHLNSGQILQADSTDGGCSNDLPGWCSRIGHKYLGEKNKKGFISYYIQKK